MIELIKNNIIIPALSEINAHSDDAADMVLVTGAVETGYKTTRQYGGGPALSWFQIEPKTHDDIFRNFLGASSKHYILEGLLKLSNRVGMASEMENNPWYAAAICRIHYLRVKEKLPEAGDRMAQAMYWKKYYNTSAGRGTIGEFLERTTATLKKG